MQKQLTDLQMETLITFIRMKKVRFYDVQLEIADHFATAIEEKWQQDPQLPFEETMIQFYEDFGDEGFKQLMKAKARLVHKKWLSNTLQHFGTFFTWPKALILVMLILIFHQFLSLVQKPEFIFRWCAGIIILMAIGMSIFLFLKKPTSKPIMIYDYSYAILINTFNLGGMAFTYFTNWLIYQFFMPYGGAEWGMAIYLSLCMLFFYCTIIHVSLENYRDFQKMYASFPRFSQD